MKLAQSLYKVGAGKRGKDDAKTTKVGASAAIRVQTDLDALEPQTNWKMTIPDKNDLLNFSVAITPDQGYWKGATYSFNFKIPPNYPHAAPHVVCQDLVYHPNIDLQGRVCLNILRDSWRPILEIQSVIYGLIFLFLEPNPDDPLNNEAAEVLRRSKDEFKRNVDTSLRGGYVGGQQFPKMQLK